jgi:hypothetical protein
MRDGGTGVEADEARVQKMEPEGEEVIEWMARGTWRLRASSSGEMEKERNEREEESVNQGRSSKTRASKDDSGRMDSNKLTLQLATNALNSNHPTAHITPPSIPQRTIHPVASRHEVDDLLTAPSVRARRPRLGVQGGTTDGEEGGVAAGVDVGASGGLLARGGEGGENDLGGRVNVVDVRAGGKTDLAENGKGRDSKEDWMSIGASPD